MSEVQFAQTVSAQEEWEESMANRQIELDQELTSEDLYNIGMESDTAALKMRALCYRTGIQYPPQKQEMGLQPPVSAEFN